jgi:hypothetical protein
LSLSRLAKRRIKSPNAKLQIPYPGGKGRLAKQIVSFLPKEGGLYLEPFAGRGNLFWAAVEQGLQYRRWWLNDIATAPFFEAILSHGQRIKVPPRSRQEFERQRDAYKSGDPKAVLLAPHLAFSGGLYESGCKGGAGCGDDDGGVSSKGFQQTLRDCRKILLRTRPKITGLDWRQLGLEKLTEDDVVLLDPPYMFAQVKAYNHETVGYEQLGRYLTEEPSSAGSFAAICIRFCIAWESRFGHEICSFYVSASNKAKKIEPNVCGATSPRNPATVVTRCQRP